MPNWRLFYSPLFALLAFLLLPAWTAQAQTLSATFNTATDVPVTANGYTASGTVNFTLNFAPATGTNLTVVKNTSLNFIQGAFSNLAQGQVVTFTFGGFNYTFVANYYGGTGNDLVLVWANNRALAWGQSALGQLGTLAGSNPSIPTAVNSSGVLAGKTILAVAAGAAHTLALASDGTLAAWGDNNSFQLGNNNPVTQITPVAVTVAGTALAGKTVAAISAGSDHSVALCSDGTVAAWGDNYYGELGNGSMGLSIGPVMVSNSSASALFQKHVVAISAGDSHTLALCSDGTVAAWGNNNQGQLGNGSTNANNVPVAVSTAGTALAGKTVIAIAAGNFHSLALCSDGTVAAWGYNDDGELGNGGTNQSSVPVAVSVTGTALAGKTVVAIAAGQFHSMALCSNGTVAAWGDNSDDQLGNTVNSMSAVPFAVNTTGILSGKTVTAISAGAAEGLARCSDGTLAAWGTNSDGELGNNSSFDSRVPVAVNTSSLRSGEAFVFAASGPRALHCLGIAASPPSTQVSVQQPAGTSLISSASVVNFGASSLGIGVPLNFSIANTGNAPLNLSGVTIDGVNSSEFAVTTAPSSTVPINSSTTMVITFTPSITFGSNAALHIQSNDPLTGSFTVRLVGASPSVLNASFTSASSVATTGNGFNATGSSVNLSLNYAPITGANLTVINNTGADRILGTFANLAQGQSVVLKFGGVPYQFVANYCGGTGNDLVLQWASNRVLAWGANNDGEAGDGSLTTRFAPVAILSNGVLNGKTFLRISSGNAHSAAVCTDGTLATWGDNSFGQLGTTSNVTESLVPLLVANGAGSALLGKTVVNVCTGDRHCVALCSDGTVVAWGYGSNGELGSGIFTLSKLPVAVNAAPGSALYGKTVTALSSGANHILALCSDGTVVAWGYNADGELGNGSLFNSSVPVAVNTAGVLAGKTVVAIAGGEHHSLVLCSDGTLAGWGYNDSGQLGNGTTSSSSVPVAVNKSGALAGKTVVAISAGMDHNLALCSDGTVVGWGFNLYGELGSGAPNNYATPVVIPASGALSGRTVVGIATGIFLSMAVCSDGTLVSWGSNMSGQLGNNGSSDSSVPVLIVTSALTSGEVCFQVVSGPLATHEFALVAEPVSAGIQSWRTQTFGSNAGNTTISGDNADPNGNGILNLMEYALNGDPAGNTAGTNILPKISSNPATDTLQFSFTRYQNCNDVTLTVQANDSLTGTWTNLAQSVNGAPFTITTTGATVNESGSGNAVSVTIGDLYQMNDPAHSHRFMRLQVTRP